MKENEMIIKSSLISRGIAFDLEKKTGYECQEYNLKNHNHMFM